MDWQAGLSTVEILSLDFRTSKNENNWDFEKKTCFSTNWIGKLASLQSRLDFDNDWQPYKNTLLEKESLNISKHAQNTTLFLHVNWRPKLDFWNINPREEMFRTATDLYLLNLAMWIKSKFSFLNCHIINIFIRPESNHCIVFSCH